MESRAKQKTAVSCMLLLGSCLLGVDVLAQQTPQELPGVLLEQQRRAEEEKKRQEQITQPQAPPQIEKPVQPRRPRGPEAKVTVTAIKITGNTVIPTSKLEKLVASAIGKELTVRELNEVADLISEYYIGEGYILGRAYLPPQEIKEGVVEMADRKSVV